MFSTPPLASMLNTSPLLSPLLLDSSAPAMPASPWDPVADLSFDEQDSLPLHSPWPLENPPPIMPVHLSRVPEPPSNTPLYLPLSHLLPPPTSSSASTPPPTEKPKRSPSPAPSVPPPPPPKKSRTQGERISSKDFVPPDVTGLTKREARLVKNRAAAFLSRQRKREEFEHMEVRVGELEQENARLQALASGSGAAKEAEELRKQLEEMRSRLAESEERENALRNQIERMSVEREQEPQIKPEPVEHVLPKVSGTTVQKQGAGLGLMVLLFSLSTLLSVPSAQQSGSIPTRFSFSPTAPPTAPASFSLDNIIPRFPVDSDMMDFEFDELDSAPSSNSAREFQVSLDPSADNKIRIRIHPAENNSGSAKKESDDRLLAWDGSELPSLPFFQTSEHSDFLSSTSFPPSPRSIGYGSPLMSDSFSFESGSDYGFSPSLSSSSGPLAGKRTVRLRVKPSNRGDWEVEVHDQ